MEKLTKEQIKKQMEDLQKKQEEIEQQEEEELKELEKEQEEPLKIPSAPKPEYNEQDLIYNLTQCSRKIKDLEDQIRTRSINDKLSKVDLINMAEELQQTAMGITELLVSKFGHKKEEVINIIKRAQEIKTYYGYKWLIEPK